MAVMNRNELDGGWFSLCECDVQAIRCKLADVKAESWPPQVHRHNDCFFWLRAGYKGIVRPLFDF